MKRVLCALLEEGQIIAEDIYMTGNQILVPKGVIITRNIIGLLQDNGITTVEVEDNPIELKDPSEGLTCLEMIQGMKEFQEFERDYNETVKKFGKRMNDLVEKNIPIEPEQFLSETMDLLKSTGQGCNVLDFLTAMRNYDDSTFCHCINVSLICGIFSDWLKLSEEEKKQAMLCGLFHDLGKLLISPDIIKKPSSLTEDEYEIVRTHPKLGYDLLKTNDSLQSVQWEHMMNAALMHHERCDGTGYPSGLSAIEIDYYAKMVAIVDVYDAMTSARVYREAICPFKVLHHFEEDGLQKYDQKMIMVFLEHVVNTYINHSVRLSNGKIGSVILMNKVFPSMPTVKCEDTFIDLTKKRDITIESIL